MIARLRRLRAEMLGLNRRNHAYLFGYNPPDRYRLVDDGRTLEVTFTVDDEGAFTMPWSASQRYQKAAQSMEEVTCAEGEAFAPIQDPQQALFPIPRAAASDF